MDVIKTIYKRRSIRNYLDKPVKKDAIMTLLKVKKASLIIGNWKR